MCAGRERVGPGLPVLVQQGEATLQDAGWNNSEVLGRYSAEAIRSLKDSVGGNLYVSGSGTLVQAMLADGLVDELHLFVFPLVVGAGRRLFGDGDGDAIKLELTGTDAYDSGVVHLAYTAV